MEARLDADIDQISSKHSNDELVIKLKDMVSGEVKQLTVKKFDHVHNAIHEAFSDHKVNQVMAGNHPVTGAN